MTAIEWLMSCATEFDVEIREVAPNSATVNIPVPRSSGTKISYLIDLQGVSGNEVIAKELAPKKLPSFCPDRHINPGGSFCLYWAKGDRRPITNTESASDWWRMLIQYLGWQATATQLRRWVGGSRAHGDAAETEAEAELIGRSFGHSFERDLRNGVFHVQRRVRHHKQYLELYRNGLRIARVGMYHTATLNARTLCPCDSSGGKRHIVDCGTHLSDLKKFIKLVHKMSQENQVFYYELRRAGQACCGSLDYCPLRV